MIHEMLYQSHDISKIEYGKYIQKLISELVVSMKGEKHNIKLVIDVPDIKLDINTSIPLSLLVNEVVTNALKYGILDDAEGEIHFKMRKIDDEKYQLFIGDNGIGYDQKNEQEPTTLGLKLIDRLVAQLDGQIEKINDESGSNYKIIFQEID